MEQNREPRNKATHLQSVTQNSCVIDTIMTKKAGIHNGEKTISSTSDIGTLDSYMQINEIRTLPHTIYKNKLKMV